MRSVITLTPLAGFSIPGQARAYASATKPSSVFFTHSWGGKYAQDFPFLISDAYGSGPVDASKKVLRSGLKIPLLHFE
ncbi:MAG: hypothetical protein K0M58_00100 [Thiobacillus sp.]|nr:hypothetical protein [Thiobacillus sp.]